ncbi:cold shock domain-containing protein [Neobacillus sp. SCS-31]|uniref:cold shock domain-containing protein n=1 Tax=Neobacillus oceani TaxID=3115292 RepID=UPI003906758B
MFEKAKVSYSQKGKVKWFNNIKGYGFIEEENGNQIFVHYSEIEGDGFKTLKEGQPVGFNMKLGGKGPIAEKVVLLKG